LGSLAVGLFCAPAAAQTPADSIRKNHGGGLTLTMKTFQDLKTPKAVALEESGLAKGGRRYRIADAAYVQLEQGLSIDKEIEAAFHTYCEKLSPQGRVELEDEFLRDSVTTHYECNRPTPPTIADR
jgi:hypothetical protein